MTLVAAGLPFISGNWLRGLFRNADEVAEVATSAIKAEKGSVEAAAAALPAGTPAQVTRNALTHAEFAQAHDIVALRGGHFEGAPTDSFPGIDGWLNGTPVSLKEATSLKTAAQRAGRAAESAKKAQYTGVELYINAPGVSEQALLDFGKTGPLANIPKEGTISTIYVKTADGWVVFRCDFKLVFR